MEKDRTGRYVVFLVPYFGRIALLRIFKIANKHSQVTSGCVYVVHSLFKKNGPILKAFVLTEVFFAYKAKQSFICLDFLDSVYEFVANFLKDAAKILPSIINYKR